MLCLVCCLLFAVRCLLVVRWALLVVHCVLLAVLLLFAVCWLLCVSRRSLSVVG